MWVANDVEVGPAVIEPVSEPASTLTAATGAQTAPAPARRRGPLFAAIGVVEFIDFGGADILRALEARAGAGDGG